MAADTLTLTPITNTTSMLYTPEGVQAALFFSILILLVILIPYMVELICAYRLARQRDEQAQELLKSSVKEFIETLKTQKSLLTDEQIGTFYEKVFEPIQEKLNQPVTGVSGATRGIIAFAIIFTVGMATMLVMFATAGDSQLVNNVVSMLAATLATIAGFYFGGRTVQETAAAAADQTKKTSPPSATTTKPEDTSKAVPPSLKVKGIKIGATKKIENGITIPIYEVDIFEDWGAYGTKELSYHMDPITEYRLYCNVESSLPDEKYDIYIDPLLKKSQDTKPFLYELRETFEKMIPHPKQNMCYVKAFDWFINYQNWCEPGDYSVILKIGYLKKGTALGTSPNWVGTEEFIVHLT